MKLVKKIRLVFREGKSDKVYEVDLVELPGGAVDRYLVNFRYGRRGSALREGTKTVQPLPLAEAESVYQSIVVSKTNSGYWDETGPAPVRAASDPDQAPDGDRQQSRTAALLKALNQEKDSQQRGRIIWNLGQGRPEGVISAVIAHANRGEWLEDYSIAWTLGRFRDATGIATLEKLQRHANAHVRGIALEALLLCVSPATAASLLQPEVAELPPTLRSSLEAGHEPGMLAALQSFAGTDLLNRSLVILYHQALLHPGVHRVLLQFLAACSLEPGAFKGIRHVFKAAELRVDYDVFACLTHRLEKTPPFFRNQWGRAYVPGKGMLVVAKELAAEKSRLAYSDKTRLYLRRRAWRTLRRLGRADSPHYVALAVSVLLQVRDSDAATPRTLEFTRWNSAERTERRVRREYDEWANLLVFNHILRDEDPAYDLGPASRAWHHKPKKNGEAVRGEAFPHLWNRTPAAALDLLKRSLCSPVHDAAIRMLAGQTAFLAQLSAAELAQLLLSPYLQTVRFALPLAEQLLSRGGADEHLVLALLRSPLEEARELGVRVLTENPEWVRNHALVIEMLLCFEAPVPELVDQGLGTHTFSEADQQQIGFGAVTQLLSRNLPLSIEAAEKLARILSQRLPAAVAAMPVTLLDRLLSQPEAGPQLLGARLLAAGNLKFAEIPGRLLQHIHGSAHEEVRAIAIALLGKQSSEDLLLQTDNLAELLHRGGAAERRELLAVFDKLAAEGGESLARVLRSLSPLLFRSEQHPGQADELMAFFLRHRAAASAAFDKDMVWRLLQAQANTAQRVGAVLLQARNPLEFSVKQWGLLASHADHSARLYAMAAFEAHEPRVKQHARDALRFIETPWDDAREFGFRYFREKFTDAEWTPELIIGVCDSNRPPVQELGRELLQRFFQQQQGPMYLAALSQHPSINVQLFASGFLESHAGGHRDRILLLRGYFVTVLSQVNKARTCKDRVLGFLLRESLKDATVAAMVAEVFTRVSLTVVQKDRSQLLKSLIALHRAYPQLSVPIKAVPVTRGV